MNVQADPSGVPPVQPLPVYGFVHVATHGRWRDVFAELVARLRDTGLRERTTKVFVGVVGPEADSFDVDDEKFECVHRSQELKEYEFPTLRRLHELCLRSGPCLVYYVHTKGVCSDAATVPDWRAYMQHFVVDRYEESVAALRTHDMCGVNLSWVPWPHFSGNFWWARSEYVARLLPIDALPPMVPWLEHRHQCERWIGSGRDVRPLCLHQSLVDHYHVQYPPARYADTMPNDGAGDAVQCRDGGEPPLQILPPADGGAQLMTAFADPAAGRGVAVIFDDVVRPDTTGVYCLAALRRLFPRVTHVRPSDLASLKAFEYDLFLFIDDGLDYGLPAHLRPSAMWAIDTHLNPGRLLRRTQAVDYVFAAQRDGVELLRRDGVNCVGWLPLACDPEVHRKHDAAKSLDVCFVGHICTPARQELTRHVKARYPRSFVGQQYFHDMARTYSASRVVLNLSVKNDLNMRVFEALACGSLLLTNELGDDDDNGLSDLFTPGEHLVTFRDNDDLLARVDHYMAHEDARERIAAAGRQHVLAHHTYLHRMCALVAAVEGRRADARVRLLGAPTLALSPQSPGNPVELPSPPASPPPEPLTSIVIVTFNGLTYTRMCLDGLRGCTPERHEVVAVDNGSTDGTVEYLRSHPEVRLIENGGNRGFPAAANQGIAASRGTEVVLLNNDVVVTPGWLGRLRDALGSVADVGLAGPCSNEVSGPQQVPADYADVRGLHRFAEDWAARHEGVLEETERLVGFCLMLRRDVIDRVGLLDERFGVGNFEDDDYCRRARQSGFRAVIARGCFVHHFGSASFKENGVDYAGLMERNRKLFLNKWSRLDPGPGEPAAEPVHPPGACDAQDVAPRLSLCMIVRDSARTLGACLDSIRPWVDEMVVVDTGSVDDTRAIAERGGARVRSFPWCDDFSAARNASLREARGEWVFWMDADDTIDERNGRMLRDLVNREHPALTLGFVLQVHCPGGRDAGPYDTATVVDHVKVFRNHPGLRFSGRIHEQVLPAIRRLGGDVVWTGIHVEHSGSDTTPAGRARKQARDLRLLELELSEAPDETFTLFNLGMTLLDASRPADALPALCRALQLACDGESHVRKLYAFLAQCYSDLGRPRTALRTCAQGLAVFPHDPELTFRKGVLEQSLGALEDAERSFRSLVEVPRERVFSSVDCGILGVKAWHNLATVLDQQGRPDEAAAAWRRVVGFGGSNWLAWRGLLDSLSAAGDVAAIEDLACGRDGDVPDDVAALLRAWLSAHRGDAPAAVAELERAWQRTGSVELLRELSELAFRHGALEAAERGLTEMARQDPADASTCQNLGLVHLRRERHEDAARWALRSLELRPSHPAAQALLAEALEAGSQGRSPRCTEGFIVLFPDPPAASRAGVAGPRHPQNTWLGRALKLNRAEAGMLEIEGVKGYLLEGDVHLLARRAMTLPDGAVLVEVGSWMGLSAIVMASGLLAAGNHAASISCVDTWAGSTEHRELAVVREERLYDTFIANVRGAGVSSFVRPLRRSSDEAALAFADGTIDLLFLDADHSSPECLADLRAWWPKMRTGGTILVHDCVPGGPVEGAVTEFVGERCLSGLRHGPPCHYVFEISCSDRAATASGGTKPPCPATCSEDRGDEPVDTPELAVL